MSLPPFAYHVARSFEEAFELRRQYGDEARWFSGGTALMLLMRADLLHPAALIGVCALPDMRGIRVERDCVRIGAATPHAEVAASPEIRRLLPVVAETFNHIATRRVRNVGTAGGNLAHANPHQDPPTTLTAFNARVVARGANGERRIPLDGLFTGYFETSLQREEILTAIEIPLPAPRTRAAFIKFLPRSHDDYATVNVAVCLTGNAKKVEGIRIAVGSMGATVLRSAEAESLLVGRAPDEARLKDAARAAIQGADPELDSRGSPAYKMQVAPVIVRRAIEKALAA